MDVSLSPELERYVHGKVRNGAHPSADEVISEGLRLLQRRDERRRLKLEGLRRMVQALQSLDVRAEILRLELEELRRMVQVGIDQADRRELKPFDEDMLAEVRAAARGRKLEDLRRAIQVGIDQADRGELEPLDAVAILEEVRASRARRDIVSESPESSAPLEPGETSPKFWMAWKNGAQRRRTGSRRRSTRDARRSANSPRWGGRATSLAPGSGA